MNEPMVTADEIIAKGDALIADRASEDHWVRIEERETWD